MSSVELYTEVSFLYKKSNSQNKKFVMLLKVEVFLVKF